VHRPTMRRPATTLRRSGVVCAPELDDIRRPSWSPSSANRTVLALFPPPLLRVPAGLSELRAVALQVAFERQTLKLASSLDRLYVMGLKGYRLWVMGQLD
jgi:hypothetical protein